MEKHPIEYPWSSREIQNPPERYALIELADLSTSCGFANVRDFQRAHRQWIEEALRREAVKRDERWSEAIAVGSHAFVERVKRELGISARHREVDEEDGTCELREQCGAYTSEFGTENAMLRPKNTIFWRETSANA